MDVVLVGDGWMNGLFELILCDGKLYVCGVVDDKGLIIVGYYVLKIIKELGLLFFCCVRIIVGFDEESGMSCVECYFEIEE